MSIQKIIINTRSLYIWFSLMNWVKDSLVYKKSIPIPLKEKRRKK